MDQLGLLVPCTFVPTSDIRVRVYAIPPLSLIIGESFSPVMGSLVLTGYGQGVTGWTTEHEI
jgi:hypothetical protein